MLVAEGAKVILADVQDEAGQQLASELGQTYVHCDVTSEADGQAVVDAAQKAGTLFGLVNCAGVAPAARTVGKNGPHALDRSEEHTSELQSLMRISYAVFCLKKKSNTTTNTYTKQLQ